MYSTILDVLKEFDLNDQGKLEKQINQMSPDDWFRFCDSLDEFYQSMPELRRTDKITKPLSFCLPSFSPEILPNISTHLLVADQVYLDDPLYDTASMLEALVTSPKDRHSPLREALPARLAIGAEINEYFIHWQKERLLSNAASYIDFYLRSKELLLEKRLIPYKQIEIPKSFVDFIRIGDSVFQKDKRIRQLIYGKSNRTFTSLLLFIRILNARYIKRIKSIDAVMKDVSGSEYINAVAKSEIALRPLLISLSVLALSGGMQGKSIDFISTESAHIFRKALEVASLVNERMYDIDRILLPSAFSLNGFSVPIIFNVPIERVLDTIDQEPYAYEAFRGNINSQLALISAPAGSMDREKQIIAIQESITRDISNIKLAHESIRKTYSRKFWANIGLGSASIMVAGISTLGQNLDILAIGGRLVAGAGLITSLKDFARDWVEYQQQILNVKSDDNYFVWKILSDE